MDYVLLNIRRPTRRFILNFFPVYFSLFLRERERAHESWGGGMVEREGERDYSVPENHDPEIIT